MADKKALETNDAYEIPLFVAAILSGGGLMLGIAGIYFGLSSRSHMFLLGWAVYLVPGFFCAICFYNLDENRKKLAAIERLEEAKVELKEANERLKKTIKTLEAFLSEQDKIKFS